MILQVVTVPFDATHTITVTLRKPSSPQTRLAVAVIADKSVAMVLSDGPGGSARLWKCASTVGSTHLWHRFPGPLGGLEAFTIETAHEQRISGSVLAIETAGLTAVDALQRLSDLVAGAR